jgi:hypothetical protein
VSDPLAPIADKIKPLIRLLSSDQSGEDVAAARVLVRTLKANGLDVQVLADCVGKANGKKFTNDDAIEIYRRGVEDGQRAAESARGEFRDIDAHDEPSWHDIACECARQRLRNDREREFVQDMVRRTVRGGKLSEKQASWLSSIYARVR